jgi:hypothetical protein
MTFKEPKGKWFQEDLKDNRRDFKNVENCIESVKFRYGNENHSVEWVLGISTALFLSLSIADVLNNPKEWVRVAGFWGYIIILLTILTAIILYLWANIRQKRAMVWLYREKDKQENVKEKK